MEPIVFPDIGADPLGESLHYLRMSGAFYSHCELTAPWGIEMPDFSNALSFHVVTQGRCVVESATTAPIVLQPGELVLLPRGDGHRLLSSTGAESTPLFDLPHHVISPRYDILRIHGGGDPAHLICGVIRFDHPAGRHLLEMLPSVIHVDTARAMGSDWMYGTLRIMAEEARAMKPGSEAVVTRLADILVIQALRSWIEQAPAVDSGWVGALRDRQIGRSLALIHSDPTRAWSVELLASEVAMSRSAFSERFTNFVGESPMRYVTRWRMYRAMNLLREQRTSSTEAAELVGYESEAAFNRAFKRIMGITPGAARRAVAEPAWQPH